MTNVAWDTASSDSWVTSGPQTYRNSGVDNDWSGYNSGQTTCNPDGTLNEMSMIMYTGSSAYGAMGFTQTLATEPNTNTPGVNLSFQNGGSVRLYYDGSYVTISDSSYNNTDVWKLRMLPTQTLVYKNDVLKHTLSHISSGDYKAFGICYNKFSSHTIEATLSSTSGPSGSGTLLPPPYANIGLRGL